MHIVPPIKPMFGITKFLSRDVYPDRPSSVANGDVGIVLGDYKTKAQKRLFPIVEVEFTSRPGHDYPTGTWRRFSRSSPRPTTPAVERFLDRAGASALRAAAEVPLSAMHRADAHRSLDAQGPLS